MRTLITSLLLLLALSAAAGAVHGQQPKDEPPLWLDFDMEDTPEPEEAEAGYAYDFVNGSIFQQIKQAFDIPRIARLIARSPKQAYNVNSVGGVPDSSWFTNRHERKRMSREALQRGPNRDSGPAGEVFTVVRGKTAGITPGFWIRDERGATYIVKFDPPDYPEMSTGAEMIATKLFHAIGYNVPENHIFYFSRGQLQVAENAEFTDAYGQRRAMTAANVERILELAARRPDGRYRALASRLLDGKPKGGFRFHGVRKDDPNDIIPHEHRRDLRGLRVFAAWLEHNDIRAGNTLDVYVEEDGRRFLRHYLIDFGSTLGSDTVFPNVDIVGHEYILDWGEAGKVLITGGIYQPPWRKGRAVVHPSVGSYTAEKFEPQRWKQNFPLVAFENMTGEDAAWAAGIVGGFTDADLRAIVETAEFTDAAAADYLARHLAERRDKIVRAYLQERIQTERAGIH